MQEIENLIKAVSDNLRDRKVNFLIVVEDENGLHNQYRVKDNTAIRN